MESSRTGNGGSGNDQKSPANGWAKLTWDDLESWAGKRSVSRGRTYQQSGHVKNLAISASGELLATVEGGDDYTTLVSLIPGETRGNLTSACTCPVGIACKHAVATVADYLQAVAEGRKVPLAAEKDPRWDDLEADDDWYDNEDEDVDEDEQEAPKVRRQSPPTPDFASRWDEKIEQHIRDQSQAELVDLVWSLARRFPEIYQEFREKIALQSGDLEKLLSETRREIKRVTSESAWSDRWNDGGSIPDYRPIQHRLERLLEQGHADEVVALGQEFLTKGLEQVGQANDEEGETATAFSETLPVIFQALMQSSRSPAEKLLFAINAELDDTMDTVGEAVAVVFDASWNPEDWSAVADALMGRLKADGVAGTSVTVRSFRDYQRDSLTDWIASALDDAGRSEEVVSLFESEARITGSYERLVHHLIENQRFGDAERWAKEGIAATADTLSGISANLAQHLCQVAEGRHQWDVVAAHAARKFFGTPSASSFDVLIQAARKAGVEAPVRAVALRFLETGIGPFERNAPRPVTSPRVKVTANKKSATKPSVVVPPEPVADPSRLKVDPDWPLPVPEELLPLMTRPVASYDPGPRPRLDVLLDMAIAANEPVEVLRWYDRMVQDQQRPGLDHTSRTYADQVANAVKKTHPDRSIEIYTAALNSQLPNAQPSAYEAAADYLRKLRPIYEALGRLGEWKALVTSIRERYRNRPRFMEILDRLDGRTILDSSKPKRK